MFYPPSPRAVDLRLAAAIAASTSPFTKIVGVFVNPSAETVWATLDAVRLDLLQFHGDESRVDCEQYQIPYIKAMAMKPGVDVAAETRRFSSARGLLLDAWHEKLRGGSGTSFDWSRVPKLDLPVILAGGLDATNVARAIASVRPYAVDVSGGVEMSKGIKDTVKMTAFVEAVNGV